ncbi:hypothetical membrane protein [Brachyspira suanatina]|uniref:Hypothetical membrane protein n=1 Tax=Brachyspira suanatina TaxID=381802 RepID=A0A0G4KAR8_9SPIR|nr:DUF2142 domain-containing protein [Brachyspira suanatina]CRF35567.1 hypothetical membrane protein [Brachyspira suanatina]
MNNKHLFFKIYLVFIVTLLISIMILSLLGKKERIGYLSEFKFDENHINKTLELNGFNVDKTKKIFTSNNVVDNEALTDYIFTNKSITNYSYGFRVKYYDKIFRNSDIYGVYIDTNKIIQNNYFIKEINIDENGSPFGNLVATKIIDFEKIDSIYYTLSIKPIIIIVFLFLYIFLAFFYYKFFLFEKIYKYIVCIILLMYIFLLLYVYRLNILYIKSLIIFGLEIIFIFYNCKNISKLNNINIVNKITILVSILSLIFVMHINIFIKINLNIKYNILFIYFNIFYIILGIFIIKKFNLINLKNIIYIIIFVLLFNINLSYNYLNLYNNSAKFMIFFIYSFILSSFFFVFYSYSEYKQMKIEKIFLVSFTIIGLSYMVLLPYLETPDEGNHFLRSYEISQGHLISDKNDKNYGGRTFESNIVNMTHRISSYNNLISNILKQNTVSSEMKFIEFPNTALYSFISYIPQSLGIALGNIFNLNYLKSAYLGRLFNFIFFVILTYLSIKYVPLKKISLYIIMFFPMVLQETISLAVDPIVIAASSLLIAICLNIKYRDKYITIKEIILLYILVIFISGSKITYLPICFILFIIPKTKFKNNKFIIILPIIILSILINFIWLKFSINYSNIKWTNTINEKEQIHFVFNNIFQYCIIFVNTILKEFFTNIKSMIGKDLSWFDISIPNASYYIFLFLLVIILVFDNKVYINELKIKLVLFFIILISIGLILSALYVSWTPVGNNIIIGIQGRYFLPILFYILILLSNRFLKLDFELIKNYIFIIIIMNNILVLNKIFITFYK